MVALALFAGGVARAQTDEGEAAAGESADGLEPGTTDADAIDTSDLEGSERLGDEQVLVEERLGVEQARSGTDPYEDPTAAYYFLGLAYWHSFNLEPLIGLFTDAQTGTNNPAMGLQFTYRKDSFDIVTSLYYQTFAVEGPFRGAGDEVYETEFINSDLKMIAVSADFLWGSDITDWFAVQYGIGVGIGVTFGDLVRTEAYESTGPGSVGGFAACDGPGSPATPFCELDGGHYRHTEPRWTGGGSVPNVWFRLAPQLALRFKPIKQLMIRVFGGFDFGSVGPFVGGSMAFGFGG